MDVLKDLERTDKWYLGGGSELIWAPPFPLYLDKPGFWDKASLYNCSIEPVFTYAFLDEESREIGLHATSRRWNPAVLTQLFTADGLDVVEEKAVLENGVLACRIRVVNSGDRDRSLSLVAWTAQEVDHDIGRAVTEATPIENGLSFTLTARTGRKGASQFQAGVCLGINKEIQSRASVWSQRTANLPEWRLTPFYERMRRAGDLSDGTRPNGAGDEGLLYMGIHTPVHVRAGGEASICVAAAVCPSVAEAHEALLASLNSASDPITVSEVNWRRYFDALPHLSISDPYIQNYYWYRWYGLRLMTIKGGRPNYEFPAVCEGIDYFHMPISYSAQCHMRETRWMRDPSIAHGCLLNFGEHQNDEGCFRGHLFPVKMSPTTFFYHADWGTAAMGVDELHPDMEFIAQSYSILSRYVRYLDKDRDRENTGLYDIVNHYETGQEYSSRYTAVCQDADKDGGSMDQQFRLKGVDVTVYVYSIKKALSEMALMLGNASESEQWERESIRIRNAVVETMWDPEDEMFYDVDPGTLARTKVRTATCFYPYFTDIVSEEHLHGLKRNLLDPEEFWTPFPAPSLSLKDCLSSEYADWKGKRHNCPWNGRVWPMTNSHIAEALAISAQRFGDVELQRAAALFVERFIRMMFYDGDHRRPNCFEHYNPFSGQECSYRGIDDYQHSWVVDLILKYIVGLRPASDGSLRFAPLPPRAERFELTNLDYRGHSIEVRYDSSLAHQYMVSVDGEERAFNEEALPAVLVTGGGI
ncbi:MAG: trehalase family glycosidase [Clostridia bacterium]|nr:trehalase family glycosidase [Clostridia bacterium]